MEDADGDGDAAWERPEGPFTVGSTGSQPGGSDRRSRSGALLAAVREPVVEYEFVDGTATVRTLNDDFRETFGGDADLVARPLAGVLGASGDRELPELARVETPTARQGARETVDGWREFEVRIVPVASAGGDPERQLALYSDLSAQREYDRKLEALHAATRDLIQQDCREAVAQTAVDAAVEILELPASSVNLHEPERGVLVPTAVSDGLDAILGDPPALPVEGSLAGRVLRSGDPVRYEDPSQHPEVYNPDTPMESEVILPLDDHGVLMTGSTEPAAFTDADISLITVLASNTGAALDRIEREETLARRERELQQKNEQLEAFASMVSHDLRNPLNVAQGRLEAAREDRDDPDLRAVAEAHERMETLIADLLELARLGEQVGDCHPVDVAVVARAAWQQVRTASATLELASEFPTVRADETRLAAVFENLFRNAIEHGGRAVTLRVGPTESGFHVSDDGPGVPAAERERVFEIGHTSDEYGTGMGLAIVREVAQAHGWSVSLGESDAGGARFEFDVDRA